MTGPADHSLLAHVRRLAASNRPALAFDAETPAEWQAWQTALRSRLTELLGGFPAECGPLDVQITHATNEGSYVRERLTFRTEPGLRVPAYLLRPKRRPPERRGAAVLCLHGHGRGKDDVAAVAATPRERQQRVTALSYDYGARLAERGYVVLVPDARGFGEWAAADGMNCGWAATSALLLGTTLVGMRVRDAMRAIDLLVGLPDVDPTRVGCVGLSWGGTHTMWTAALDDRVAAAVVSGAFGRLADSLIESSECPCQVVPGLLPVADLPDIVSLIAPRPLLLQSGLADQHYTPEVVAEAFGVVRQAYAVAGAPGCVALDQFAGGHVFRTEAAVDWLNGRL
ncbi:MAG: hypothetical protein AVDCRST_MAG70-240 [uncultured Thermomicrobiales bacterium]|uniref:Acetyl xylan esterase domain-containing protein n=1 Tax=uncultured Thermomicrobiales bacterium TaxID=1645740 RepID=A0A6J4U7R9_9BACT|nr:MAG: hypothetical protein AVDCRST_MAG70-240 [uncultured Thermomicrobiales bacterium]